MPKGLSGRLVSNTGPIIALMIVDRLDILDELFDEVVISDEVHRELLEGRSRDFESIMRVALYEGASFIKVKSLSSPLNPLIVSVLDSGEASIIQLSGEIAADFVLIDERKARKIARSIYGLNVIGTARLLVEAKRHGIVATVKQLLLEMRQGGYWIADAIVENILAQAGE